MAITMSFSEMLRELCGFQMQHTSTRHANSKTLFETTVLATVASHWSYFTLFTI